MISRPKTFHSPFCRKVLVLAAWVMAALAGACQADDFVFHSDFSGKDLTKLDASGDWSPSWQGDDHSDAVIYGNLGEFFVVSKQKANSVGYCANSKPGVPAQFNPCTAKGLRFEITICRMDDRQPMSATKDNAIFTQYLSPVEFKARPEVAAGERLALIATYHRNDTEEIKGSTIDLTLIQINGDGKERALWKQSLPHVPIESGYPLYQVGALLLALELRDAPNSHLRVGYQIMSPSPNGPTPDEGWKYSPYYDLTKGAAAFKSDWTSHWENKTRWYLEGSALPGRIAAPLFDDASVGISP
jgi:hypothetical protein